ncbi:helix-turn-helix domain-containing protein [Flammeovirga sp. EKP202]|uniref:IS1/IS1595 family N-terminal zinc-binding domain-containing protein n=1 Tax=Flammeovirga sp. EKP202 TaxID=2770592 RepID=UPI00165FB313|nr:helix-turn-helix domain-containing protein [Flammeovirga sp. EKP202]MBD0403906.1 IS1 family transposase [Flammeovirga sp. EKP202]
MKISELSCPKCESNSFIKSGFVKGKQRYKCKNCNYNFSVAKKGREVDRKYVIKALQLYLEGVSYREIERILGVSHVSVMNWVKKYNIPRLETEAYAPSYQLMNHSELLTYIINRENLKTSSSVITQVGDKYMVISWQSKK